MCRVYIFSIKSIVRFVVCISIKFFAKILTHGHATMAEHGFCPHTHIYNGMNSRSTTAAQEQTQLTHFLCIGDL